MPGTEIACAICRRPLAQMVANGRETWVHYFASEGLGHLAVPIEVPEADVIHRCDFCGETGIAYEYDCEDFVTDVHDNDTYTSIGRWGACRPCSALIEAGEWDRLHARTMVRFITNHGALSSELAHDMKRIQDDFRRLRFGDRRSILG